MTDETPIVNDEHALALIKDFFSTWHLFHLDMEVVIHSWHVFELDPLLLLQLGDSSGHAVPTWGSLPSRLASGMPICQGWWLELQTVVRGHHWRLPGNHPIILFFKKSPSAAKGRVAPGAYGTVSGQWSWRPGGIKYGWALAILFLLRL